MIMKDENKTKDKLIIKLCEMRERIAELEGSDAKRKQAEDALRKSEERFRLIAETSVDYIFQVDREGVIIYASPTIQHILGYKSEDRIGHHFTEFFPPDFTEASDMFGKLMQGETIKNLQIDLLHKNGNKIPVELSITPVIQNGEVTSVYAIARDITERNKVEKALRESEDKLRNMFENVNDAIALTDLNGNFIDVNENALKILGLSSKGEILGKNNMQFVAPEDHSAVVKDMKILIEQGHISGIEYFALKKDGSSVPVELNAGLIKDSNGNPSSIIGVIRDVSVRKAIEEELQKTDRLESIGTLAGVIAHDFNNLLTGIMVFTDLAKRSIELGKAEEACNRLLEAEKACLQAKDLTKQLLTFAKGGAPI